MEIDIKTYNIGLGLRLEGAGPVNDVGVQNVVFIKGAKLYNNNAFSEVDYNADSGMDIPIIFQDGSPHANGINGGTIEAYLLACAMRLEKFQENDLVRCDENAIALNKVKEALQALRDRQVRIDQHNDRLEEEEQERQNREEEE